MQFMKINKFESEAFLNPLGCSFKHRFKTGIFVSILTLIGPFIILSILFVIIQSLITNPTLWKFTREIRNLILGAAFLPLLEILLLLFERNYVYNYAEKEEKDRAVEGKVQLYYLRFGFLLAFVLLFISPIVIYFSFTSLVKAVLGLL
jgi:hypothetical protein